ncbi:MAG: exodeoxyribonuclease VII small subunit [Salinivirgaceae bacterium]|jgi:exodeoxyribonuclease VII small subunit|nr:exodeoxyribonuclease VII small subunit [Salinivirgaceae bacterium]
MPAKFSYENAVSEIEKTIEEIENEDLSVDELSDKVKKVASLLKKCKQKLIDTKGDVDQLLTDMSKS